MDIYGRSGFPAPPRYPLPGKPYLHAALPGVPLENGLSEVWHRHGRHPGEGVPGGWTKEPPEGGRIYQGSRWGDITLYPSSPGNPSHPQLLPLLRPLLHSSAALLTLDPLCLAFALQSFWHPRGIVSSSSPSHRPVSNRHLGDLCQH